MGHSEENYATRLELKEIDAKYWVVADRFGNWSGDGMQLSKASALMLQKAMVHSYDTGYAEAQMDIRSSLGMKW